MNRMCILFSLVTSLTAQLALAGASKQLESDQFATVDGEAQAQAESFGGAQHVLVAFDIDNTLLASPQPLGSDQWFMWQAGLLDAAPESKYLVALDVQDLVEKQVRLLVHHRMRLTQPSVPMTIGRLADRGHPLLILTARGPASFDLTRRSLATAGISIGKAALPRKARLGEEFLPGDMANIAGEFDEAERRRFHLTHTFPVRYSDGIFLTAGQNKGAMLRLAVRASRVDIRAVVFIDDLEKNTLAVSEALRDTEIDVTTIRFSGEDDKIQAFLEGDKDRVHRQWRQFRQLESELFE